MVYFGLYAQVSDSGPDGPRVFFTFSLVKYRKKIWLLELLVNDFEKYLVRKQTASVVNLLKGLASLDDC